MACLLALSAHGRPQFCELPDSSSWNWTTKRLIDSTDRIVLARVVSVVDDPKDELRADYELETLEVLKGKTSAKKGSRFWIKNQMWPGYTKAEPKAFRDGPKPGRAMHDKDCKLTLGFLPGKTYLVFVDSFHPKGYELIENPASDEWLGYVRRSLPRK